MRGVAGAGTEPPGGEGGAGPVRPSVTRTALYSCLVTRHTGRAVRRSILDSLADHDRGVLVVLDFREVQLIDFSCADEVVVKLLVEADPGSPDEDAPPACFFLIRGVDEHHLDPIDSALRRQGLAVAAEGVGGAPLLLGAADELAVRAWREVWRRGRSSAAGLASALGDREGTVRDVLERLHDRRLLLREGTDFVAFRSLLPEADRRRSDT